VRNQINFLSFSIPSIPFEFVDNNAKIDRASRRRIRSHVAKGKNVGRKVVRPSSDRAFGRTAEKTAAIRPLPKCAEGAHHLENSKHVDCQIGHQLGDGLSLCISLEETPKSRGLILRAKSTYFYAEI
jgi:hypothetical protein